MGAIKFYTIDEYIAHFPKETQELLEAVRATIKNAVPEAEEIISYNMPAFKLNMVSVYLAAYKKHISLHSIYDVEKFKDEIEKYQKKGTKDTLQFSYGEPLPLELIAQIVKYKMNKS